MKVIKKGDKVKLEYVGSLEDGTVFDSSDKHEEALEFTVGDGQLIKGFDDAVVGMKVGEEKEIKINPEDAYGQHNPELVKDMPKDCFPQDQEIKSGMMFMINLQDGRQIPALITAVNDDSVTIDVNHPLAGKILVFKIKVLDVME